MTVSSLKALQVKLCGAPGSAQPRYCSGVRTDWEYVERFARQEDVVDLVTVLREMVEVRSKGRRT
jgi:hypothetical protein